jgi:membrane-anchored protein YejM (alkaline phosphatase superfamily)
MFFKQMDHMVETGNPYRDNVSRLITWGHWFSFFNIILAMLIRPVTWAPSAGRRPRSA